MSKRKLDMTPAAAAKREASRERYKLNREEKIEQVQAYKDANRHIVNAKNAAYMRERRASDNDPQFKLRDGQRRVFYSIMQPRCKMNASRVQMCRWLGMPVGKYRAHLQAQFEPEWSWAGMGKVWVIDHIVPLVSHDLTDKGQCAKAWHYTNLRPLDRTENQRKSGQERAC